MPATERSCALVLLGQLILSLHRTRGRRPWRVSRLVSASLPLPHGRPLALPARMRPVEARDDDHGCDLPAQPLGGRLGRDARRRLPLRPSVRELGRRGERERDRQADAFVAFAQPQGGDLLPVLDLEKSGSLSSSRLTAWTQAWLDEVAVRL